MSSARDEEASFAELVRQNEALLADLTRLREERTTLAAQLAVAVLGMRADRESRRAALNLLEDAVEARRAVEASNAERARLLVAARKAQAEAEQANRAKDEFLATLSHELRTPLAAILLWASALKSGAVRPGDMTMALDALVQSAKGQSRLIEDLLDLSRLSSGHFALTRTVVSVADIIRAAEVVVRPVAEAKGVALQIEAPTDLGFAHIDAWRIQQVLWNLLTNAIKFTERGGNVTLGASGNSDHVEIAIADSGEGISSEFLPQMFERFKQADMNDTREHTGLGIGLALCKSIVTLHGGAIAATSDGLGLGARFVVTLPRGDVSMPAEPETDEREITVRLDDVRVVLVEDDDNTREAMRHNLEQLGASVIALRSAAEALELLDREPDTDARIDVLLCEIGLPGMSGYELMQELARRSEAKGTALLPACAVSGRAREIDRHRAIEAGFDFHLAKPITRERLVAAVEDLREIARTRT